MRALAIIGFMLLATPALAQPELGGYVGVGFGSFDYEDDVSGVGPVLASFSDTTSSWKIYGGFNFSDHLGVEVSYGANEEMVENVALVDPFLGNISGTFDLRFTTNAIRAVGYLPFSWGSLLGGIGYFETSADLDLDLLTDCCGPIMVGDTVRDDGTTVVLGAQWRLSRVDLRLEYEWWDISEADASTIGVGAALRF